MENIDISEVCAYCEKATPLHDGETVLCQKKGVVSCGYKCHKFVYDPIKRKPIVPKPIEIID